MSNEEHGVNYTLTSKQQARDRKNDFMATPALIFNQRSKDKLRSAMIL